MLCTEIDLIEASKVAFWTVVHAHDDGSGDPDIAAKHAQDVREGEEYHARNGRAWLPPHEIYTQKPVQLPSKIPSVIGDELVVLTNTTQARFLTMRAVSTQPVAWIIDDFLSAEEADHLMSLAGDRMKRSTGAGKVLTTRTRGSEHRPTVASGRPSDATLGLGSAVAQVSRMNVYEPGGGCSEPGRLSRPINPL